MDMCGGKPAMQRKHLLDSFQHDRQVVWAVSARRLVVCGAASSCRVVGAQQAVGVESTLNMCCAAPCLTLLVPMNPPPSPLPS